MEIDISLSQNLFAALKTKLRIAAHKGVMAVMWQTEINQDIHKVDDFVFNTYFPKTNCLWNISTL